MKTDLYSDNPLTERCQPYNIVIVLDKIYVTAIQVVTMFQASSLKIPTFLTTVANDHQNVIWITA